MRKCNKSGDFVLQTVIINHDLQTIVCIQRYFKDIKIYMLGILRPVSLNNNPSKVDYSDLKILDFTKSHYLSVSQLLCTHMGGCHIFAHRYIIVY